LRLPLIQVKAELEKQIDISFINDDEVLIAFLEMKLAESKGKRVNPDVAEKGIYLSGTPLFQTWCEE